MQLFYALPFILLSLIAFTGCLIIPRLRQYAVQILVVPVTFGACSLAGLMAGALLANLGPESWNPPAAMVLGLFGFLSGGLFGAWIAVIVVRRLERVAKELLLRGVVALIVLGIVSLLSLAAAENMFPDADSWPSFLLMAAISFVVGILGAGLAYALAKKLQARPAIPGGAPSATYRA